MQPEADFDELPMCEAVTASRPHPARRRFAVIAVSVVRLAAVGPFAFGLVAQPTARHTRPNNHVRTEDPEHAVLAPLATTAETASFDIAYSLAEVPAATQGSTKTSAVSVSGAGTVKTDPFAMAMTATIPGLGAFSIWVDGTNGGGSYGTEDASSPTPAGVPAAPLSANESLVEGPSARAPGRLR